MEHSGPDGKYTLSSTRVARGRVISDPLAAHNMWLPLELRPRSAAVAMALCRVQVTGSSSYCPWNAYWWGSHKTIWRLLKTIIFMSKTISEVSPWKWSSSNQSRYKNVQPLWLYISHLCHWILLSYPQSSEEYSTRLISEASLFNS